MSLMKKYFFNNQQQFKKFNITTLLLGIGLVIFLNKIIDIYFSSYFNKNTYFIFSIFLFMVSMIGIFFLLYYVKKFLLGMNKSYDYSINKEKERLMPYEFALNNSVDAIYWFTEDAQFEYVNNAACKMLGYTKEELLGKYLEFMDPRFTRETAPLIMEEIVNTPNWRLETTQRKKTGEIFDIEVSGHGFYYNGQRYICAFGRDMSQRLMYRNNIIAMNKKLQTSLV
ncbi:MAG: PAS domain S-box protein, partial [Arcobacteraceae bacterium]